MPSEKDSDGMKVQFHRYLNVVFSCHIFLGVIPINLSATPLNLDECGLLIKVAQSSISLERISVFRRSPCLTFLNEFELQPFIRQRHGLHRRRTVVHLEKKRALSLPLIDGNASPINRDGWRLVVSASKNAYTEPRSRNRAR